MSHIKWFIRLIFPSEPNIVLFHLKPVEFFSTQQIFNTASSNTRMIDVLTVAINNTVIGEHHLCGVESQITLLLYLQWRRWATCHGARLMNVETHENIVERRCSITSKALCTSYLWNRTTFRSRIWRKNRYSPEIQDCHFCVERWEWHHTCTG